MRRNHRYYKPLALIMIAIMLCSAMILQIGISQVQADTGNLADKAVTFLKADFETNGAARGMAGFGPYDLYVLKNAGVDVSAWQHNSAALPDAVKDLVQQDISNTSAPVKYLAQDLIAMQKMGENSLASQLQTLITNRQNSDGSFQNDASVYSIIPAYELLGREGNLSIVDSVYAQNYILNGRNGATGAWADFMVTAQAVRALNYLSPGADPNSPVGQAITSGCAWMQQQQLADGSFKAALDDPLIDTAEAIATQKALGLDPAAAWTNNGKSAVDYLNNDALNADGSFGSSRNVMDATWALDSLTRLGIFPTGGGGGGGGPSSSVSVRVRVEGITSSPVDATVSVAGTALDALNQAVGSGNVVAPGGFVTSINGESGHTGVDVNTDTSWFYYVIRNGAIDPVSLGSTPGGYNVADGDQIIFYIGAYDSSTYAGKTYLPVVSVSPQAPTAGQTVTLSISAQKYDWSSGLQDLSSAEASAIGDYTVQAGGTTYTSSFGQVAIPNVAAGTLSYVITNPSGGSYPDVVPFRGSISIGQTANSSVRVRVEGITSSPVDATVSVAGTALDALNQAVGSGNVVAPAGFVTSINGESGHTGVAANTDTSWFYYVIRNHAIDANSLSSAPGGYNIADGDHIVFYIGAYDSGTYAGKTYLPVVSVSPQAPTAGQTVTLSISAQKYDWSSGLQDLSSAEASAIGDYTVQAGGTTYTSSFGQVAIPNVAAGTLSYVITNQNAGGYPNVVPYRGSISMPATVTVNDTTVTISTSAAQCDAPITVNIESGVNNTKISVAALVSTNGGIDTTQPLPALNINAAVQFQGSNPVAVQILIPAGTTISADSSWDGTIQAPTVVDPAALPSTALPSGVNISSANIIAVGFGDVPLTFSQPVKLVLPGQHGKSVGYIRNNTFTPISTVLTSNTAAALISAAAQDGYYDDGTDITIWTMHFTDFIAYSKTSGGSGGLSSPTVGVAVVGMNGERLFGPAYVTVPSTNPWGLTALGALDATGLSYTTSPTWYGFVDSIAGQPGIGTKGWMYTVNGSSPLVLAKDCPVANGDKVIWYYSNSMDQVPPTWEQLLSGTYFALKKQFTASTTGKATVFPAGGGKIGLGDEACIEIPPDALSGIDELEVSIQKVSSPPTAPQGFRLLSSVFEFSIGGSSSYKFNKPVTLTFSFDLAALPEGQKPSVYYYDASTSKWVELGGIIDGSTITVNVDHFTMFALLCEDMKRQPPAPEPLRSFIDVPASFWARDAIMKMNRLGYVSGYPDGTFRPDNQITRVEFVSVLDKVLNLPNCNPAIPDFNDVSAKDWFYQTVENAVHAGIIRGYGSSFNPDRQVTRQEMAVILVNALGKQAEAVANMGEKTSFTDDASISDWARGFVAAAVKHGLLKGYPDREFKAQGSATRAEACAVITSFLNLK